MRSLYRSRDPADKMARGHVVAQSCDANGNVICRVHANPILDTGMHQVEFALGKVTEHTANIIAEYICPMH